MKKILLSWIDAVVIATELKQFQLNFINCDDHNYLHLGFRVSSIQIIIFIYQYLKRSMTFLMSCLIALSSIY